VVHLLLLHTPLNPLPFGVNRVLYVFQRPCVRSLLRASAVREAAPLLAAAPAASARLCQATQACWVSAVWTGCDAWRCAVGEGRSRGFTTMGGMFPGGAGRMAKKSGAFTCEKSWCLVSVCNCPPGPMLVCVTGMIDGPCRPPSEGRVQHDEYFGASVGAWCACGCLVCLWVLGASAGCLVCLWVPGVPVGCPGKAGKPGKDTGDDGDAGPPLPDLDVVKADIGLHLFLCGCVWRCVAVCGLAVLSDMLDHIHVSVYGSSSSLTAVGNVVLRNSNLIVVSPFDATVSVRVLSGVVTVFDVHHKQAAACVYVACFACGVSCDVYDSWHLRSPQPFVTVG
jgi:hypothetical protein